jgi:mannosyltransferase OCH1-like enzyme
MTWHTLSFPSLTRQYNKECAKACTQRFQRGLPSSVSPADFLLKLKKLYNKNKPSTQLKKLDSYLEPEIPTIIHQIWFGGKLPVVYKIWQKRAKKLHPKWKIINWTEGRLKREFSKGLINKQTFNQAKKVCNYAQMADIARYEILNKFGGLYLDYDTKCFKSFETLHKMYSFYAELEDFDTSCYCCNTAIGAQPGHPILQRCIELISQHENKTIDLSGWQCTEEHGKEVYKRTLATGQKLFTHAIIDCIDREGFTDIVLPQEYFYPLKQTVASLCYHESHSSWKDRIKDYFDERKAAMKTYAEQL